MRNFCQKAILISVVLCLSLLGSISTPAQQKDQSAKAGPNRELTGQEVYKGVQAHIEEVLKKNNNLFPIFDDKTNQDLKLQFIKVHDDRVSIIEPSNAGETRTYFACTDFKDPATGTAYDLDFWIKIQQDGQLKVVGEKIHKSGGQPRFTYEGDKIVDIPVKTS